MDEKIKLTISLEQWKVIYNIADVLKRYKVRHYNQMNVSFEKFLDMHRNKQKGYKSWYSDERGLTLDGYLCLLAKYSIPLYAVFVLLDAYSRHKIARKLKEIGMLQQYIKYSR